MDEAKLSSFRTSFWAILDRAIIGVMGLALVGSSVAAILIALPAIGRSMCPGAVGLAEAAKLRVRDLCSAENR